MRALVSNLGLESDWVDSATRDLRASPTVWQTKLTSIWFWQNKKLVSNNFANQLSENRNLANSPPHTEIYVRRTRLASVWPKQWEGEKRNKE
jgi:hypothetical protein